MRCPSPLLFGDNFPARRHFFIRMPFIPVRKPMGPPGRRIGARLYRSEMHAHQWIAFVPEVGWWISRTK